MKSKVNDCLKYWRVIRYFIKQKYGLTTPDLDMLLADANVATNLAKSRQELTWTSVVDQVCDEVFRIPR